MVNDVSETVMIIVSFMLKKNSKTSQYFTYYQWRHLLTVGVKKQFAYV